VIYWLTRPRLGNLSDNRLEEAQTKRRRVFEKLALAMHAAPAGRILVTPHSWAANAICDDEQWRLKLLKNAKIDAARRFLEYEEIHSGIVVPVENEERQNLVRFWHPTFQEFLAAQAIARFNEKAMRRVLLANGNRLYEPAWREVILLLAAILHKDVRTEELIRIVIDDHAARRKRAKSGLKLVEDARTVSLLGAIEFDLAPVRYRITDSRYKPLRDAVLGMFDAGQPGVPLPVIRPPE
jgi:hypothetical protein